MRPGAVCAVQPLRVDEEEGAAEAADPLPEAQSEPRHQRPEVSYWPPGKDKLKFINYVVKTTYIMMSLVEEFAYRGVCKRGR